MKRLTGIIVVAALVTAGLPVMGHQVDEPHNRHQIEDGGEAYEETIVVEEQAYAKAGWWDGIDVQDLDLGAGRSADNPMERNEKVTWLVLESPNEDVPDEYVVNVDTTGVTVARLDVFRVYDSSSAGISPDCPQEPVGHLYLGAHEGNDAALAWTARLAEQATWHQAGQSIDNVRLDPADAPDGYAVAVYPAAGSGANGDATITTTVTVEDGTGFVVDDLESQSQPSDPIRTPYLSSPLAPLDCLDATPLPPQVLSLIDGNSASELPSSSPPNEFLTRLMGTSLP